MLIILSILISISVSLTPEWDLTSAKDLLSPNNTYEYTVYSRVFEFNKKLKMIRRIEKKNGIINTTNIVFFDNDENGKEVLFDNIQDSHRVFGRYLVCPYGRYHPYDVSTGEFLIPDGADTKGDWDLKCIFHSKSQIFFVGYLGKVHLNLFYTNDKKFYWEKKLSFYGQVYDFKLDNETKDGKISTISYLKVYGEKLVFSDSCIYIDDDNPLNSHGLIDIPFKKTKGFMRTNTNNFYFVTYNDTNIFYTGYTNTTIGDDFLLKNISLIFNNKASPFDFPDEVEIQEINFIFRNKFIYYKLKNKNENIFYHGIIDIELHKIIFNTKENITSFIPYSDKEMLAITPTNAYIICTYNNSGNCTDYCPEGYNIDPSGNTCGVSCPDGQYKFISNETCIKNCPISIYIIRGKKCGFCKDFYEDKPYKLINGTVCYSYDSKPEGSIIYDENLKLLKCNEDENYYFKDEICYKKIKCHENCEECTEESKDDLNQKCSKCKKDFVLEKGNCLSNCSKGYGLKDDECQECENNFCSIFPINSCNCSKCLEHYYLAENNCYQCDQNCKNCFNEKNNCTSCYNSSFLFNGQCLPCTQCKEKETNSCKCLSCKDGYFLENGQCQKCSDNCQICENNTYCNICFNGYAININNNTCSKCHENCESCSTPSYNETEQKCLSCKNTSQFLYESNCVNECGDGLYEDKQNKKCEKCNKHCKTCDAGEELNNEHCSSCEINSEYKYLVDATGFSKNCVHECPNGTILKNEKCVLNNEEKETDNKEKNEKNYSVIIISTSVAGGVVIIVAVILIIYFCNKKKKKNINIDVDKDENELMKNMGAEMEQL